MNGRSGGQEAIRRRVRVQPGLQFTLQRKVRPLMRIHVSYPDRSRTKTRGAASSASGIAGRTLCVTPCYAAIQRSRCTQAI